MVDELTPEGPRRTLVRREGHGAGRSGRCSDPRLPCSRRCRPARRDRRHHEARRGDGDARRHDRDRRPGHFQRMHQVSKAGRRPAAMLFADLESSSPLARRLSTASYFALGRRLARAADQCVIDAGGLVGRHVGDGVVAFFLAETAGSESAAARACITAARALREAMARRRRPQRPRRPRTSCCASACIGARPSTSARSRPADAPRSPRSATRSTRRRASRPARPAAARSPRRTSSSASSPTTRPRSTSTPTTSPTPRSATSPTATEKARRDAPAIAVCEV